MTRSSSRPGHSPRPATIAAVATTLLAAACSTPQTPGPGGVISPAAPDAARADGRSAVEVPWVGPKRVALKQEPNLVYAQDDTGCALSKERWAKAEVGGRVWCVWRLSRPAAASPTGSAR